jgi:outer membrane protein OmpA-like peptidoglycan-associated protein
VPETKPEPPPAPPEPPAPPPAAKESVTLLPQQDGQPSAVVVRSAGKEAVLDRPYMVATVDAGNITVSETTADKVQTEYAELLAADPPGPKKFLLFYESGDIQLTAESKKLFEQVKAELRNYPAGEVVVIAHTDSVGSIKSNDKLSLRRAVSVKALLIEIGIPESIIQVSGRGKREPLVPTKDGVAEAQNRRVELKVR